MSLEATAITSRDVVAEAIAVTKRAGELRDAAIAQLLSQREEIDRTWDLLGYAWHQPRSKMKK